MRDWDASARGGAMADEFDDWYETPDDADDAAAFLAGLAGAGPALELGIGTGQLALPLAERGVEVHGVEASEAMVERLRTKPGGQDIKIFTADFAEFHLGVSYRLVYLARNSLYLLLTQAAQRRCLVNAAQHLSEDGTLVVEAFAPDPGRLSRGRALTAGRIGTDRVVLEAARHDPVHQRIDEQHIFISGNAVRLRPVAYRYLWPAELDLMAELAGLRLRDRFGGWQREPFTAGSASNLSIFEHDD